VEPSADGRRETRADWEASHGDAAFTDTRRQLEQLEAAPSEHWRHEVIEDTRAAPTDVAA
jgi:hypothetical protein